MERRSSTSFKRETMLVDSGLAAGHVEVVYTGPWELWMVECWVVTIPRPTSEQLLQDMTAHLLLGSCLHWLECFRHTDSINKAEDQTFSRGIKTQKVHT